MEPIPPDQVVVVEKRIVGGAGSRSGKLTEGHFRSLFRAVVLGWLASSVLTSIFGSLPKIGMDIGLPSEKEGIGLEEPPRCSSEAHAKGPQSLSFLEKAFGTFPRPQPLSFLERAFGTFPSGM